MKNQLFKRKVLCSFMAVVMLFGLTALSYGAANVSVDPATVESPAVGEQLTVNINIADGEGVGGFEAQINYDNTALKYVSAAKGDYIPGDPAAGTFFTLIRPGDSHVVIAGTSIQVGTGEGDGTLATVTFEVVEVKASAITLSKVSLADAAGQQLDVTTADGAVTVPAPDPVYGVMLEGVGELKTETSDPGEGVTYTLKVTNAGDTDDVIDLAASNADATLSETSLSLESGASAEVTLTIPATALATPGDYEIKVTATSQGDSTKTAEVSTTTTISEPVEPEPDPVYGVMLAGVGDLTAEVSDTSEGVTYTINVTNAGDTDDVIDLAASNADATLSETSVSLESGALVEVTLTIPATALATPGDHEVKVTATSQGDNTKTAEVTTTTTVSTEPVAPEPQVFSITLTNLTTGDPGVGGQIFSPPIFAAHPAGVKIYEVGKKAEPYMVALAEGGDVTGLAALATVAGANSVIADGMVHPGASVTVMVSADAINSALSLTTMLVSTNDAFIGVADLPLYDEAGMPITTTLDLRSYDAGSEQNTERGTDIPGPVGLSAEEDPEGTNARVPTEGGVITNHPGIMGVGDVADSFAWTEPTAMLTIAPYVPEPPVIPPPPLPTYDVTLEPGLNMISVPLMPAEPYSAKTLSEMVGSTVVIRLNSETQRFEGYVANEESHGFYIEGGKGYIVNTPVGGTVTFSGTAWSTEPADDDGEAAAPSITTNGAWAFIVASDIQKAVDGSTYTMVAKNLRTGVVTSQQVVNENGHVNAVWADLTRKSVVQAGDKVEIALVDENDTIVSGPFQRTVQTSDIHNAYLSINMRVGDVRPKETMLGQNFPNPFNPETWIPYQLHQDANVKISIFDISGNTVRTLNLGQKTTGSYMTNSTAAYWDGKNETGEHVASGVYFYALQASNFTATRRMVILK